MGRASKLKQQRRRTAAFSVLSPGMLDVLSVGKGELTIQIGDSNKDRADAQQLIEEMLRKGYTLFVETADGPLKVRKFLPDEMVYVVADTPDLIPAEPDMPRPGQVRPPVLEGTASPLEPGAKMEAGPGQPDVPPVPRARRGQRKVPVPGSKTTAIGRTAGG